MKLRTPWLMKFALLAFLVRSFIPVGFMPGEGGHGLAPLVVCSGTGTATVFVPADKLPDSKSHVSHESPCSFSAAFTVGTLPLIATIDWPVYTIAVFATLEQAKVFGVLNKPYLSQGPPSLLQS